MKSPDGATETAWAADVTVPTFPPLAESRTADACVVGAGIAGLTTAYRLLEAGLSVVLLDEGPVGGGQTGRTSAHLASAIDDRFTVIEKSHGEEGSRLAYESHAAAIDDIEAIVQREQIDCDFARLDGRLTAGDADAANVLDEELAAAHRAGFRDAEIVPQGGIADRRCLRFPRQARFHPMRYLVALTAAVVAKGGAIFTGTRVVEVQGTDAKKKTRAFAKLAGDIQVTANHVVVATNTPSPINDWFGIYTKQSAYRTYMVGFRVSKGTIEDALYWDTEDPYHYVRLAHQAGPDDVLLVGGGDHKTGQLPPESDPFGTLEAWTRLRFPAAQEVVYHWSGQVQEPADGLGFIGKAVTSGEDVYVITGDSGMGLTHATLGARLITDLIAGRPNPWAKLYDPSRKEVNREFLKENTNTLSQYRDLVTGGDVSDIDEIAAGQGAIVREGLKKLAVYRDDAGAVHKCSAVCTHLQCIVRWNTIEKTWDCPCHGSRFDPTGKVLIGPAVDDLPPASS